MPSPEASRANGFKPGNDQSQGRPIGAKNVRSQQNQLMWRSKGYTDPLDFFGQIISDDEQPVETRLAAGNLAVPYLHSKLGAIPVAPDPTFMEISLKNPNPTCIDHCVENITLLTQAKSVGMVSIEHADSLIADQKVILYAMLDQQKQITTQGGPPEQTIHITGGLPLLPGTNITMPDFSGDASHDYNGSSAAPDFNGHGALPDTDTDTDRQPPNEDP